VTLNQQEIKYNFSKAEYHYQNYTSYCDHDVFQIIVITTSNRAIFQSSIRNAIISLFYNQQVFWN